MKTYPLFVLLLTIIGCNVKKENMNLSAQDVLTSQLLVGTYTGNGSDGIYLVEMNNETGKLTNKKLIAETSNPSYLALDSDNNIVYAVNENNPGTLTSFKWMKGEQKLEMIDQESTYGAHPCYVDVNQNGTAVAVANYSSGNVAVYPINNGQFSSSPTIRQHEGSGPREDRQKGPHAHYSKFGKNGKFLYAVDLGIDEIVAYPINNDGTVGEKQTALKMEGGDGPRHLAFHPAKNFVFVVNELSSTVTAAEINSEDGKFKVIDRESTLPEDFEEKNQCADIHVSDDGNFVYASNRGHNSIAIFAIDESGNIENLSTVPTNGDWPRNFVFSPNGNFLLVANQKSDNITVFQVDKKTGMLKETGYEIEVSSPVCLKFK